MRLSILSLLLLSMVIAGSCTKSDELPAIKVHWEHITNFTDQKDVFESKLTLFHQGGFPLDDANWTLFFNIAPRPMVPPSEPQAAVIEHINGDWYKMVPSEGFVLEKGDSIEIYYRGIEATIKETDRPLGLYFVFYNEKGEEENIVEVKDYTYSPFTKPEQINRNAEDSDPIPTPEYLYKTNEKLTQIPPEDLDLIVPSPVKMTKRAGTLTLDEEFVIAYDERLISEATFLQGKMSLDLGMDLAVDEGYSGSKAIRLSLGDVKVNGTASEAYLLKIDDTGIEITGGDAAGVFYGIQSLRALFPLEAYQSDSTLVMLGYKEIVDAPRFAFRSLQLDVSRNFQTKETLMRLLDAMAFYKLNHFLFYTTEDEGWRLEIQGLPELTEVGAVRQHTTSYKNSVLHPAYGSGPIAKEPGKNGHGYFTRADFIEILKYAQQRHIQVIPEVNFPGHARAAIKAMEYRYDRLMEEGKPWEANEFRLIDPDDRSEYLSAQGYKDNVVCVAKEQTYHFYETVVEEILSMYQEAGVPISKFHIGGDEVPEGAWTGSPLVAEFMKQHPEIENHHELHAYFIRTMMERLADKGLEWHGWEEIAVRKTEEGGFEPNPEFAGKNVVPYIWNNLFDYPDLGYKLANVGYPVVLCNVSNFYFDLAYNKDPKEPGLYWAGFINERDSWTFAPYNMFRTTLNTAMGHDIHVINTEVKNGGKVDIVDLSPGDESLMELERLKPEAYKNIVGIEAQVWSETIKGREMLEYYYLPKLIGFAESAWVAKRSWEDVDYEQERKNVQEKAWNIFANLLANKELPRFGYLNGGYHYRVPPPGAIIEEGILKANTEYPGMEIYYSLDGTDPGENALLYQEPVKVEYGPKVKLIAVDRAGRSSRVIAVD
jgi:hexosaminidase